mmetsp:Transcript_37095/g.72982  ORF Transcript_37095/g.72982 Transcript_37095/m.72982 type:complete len:100 (+) Transcript_37095:682-981(+)
MHSPKKADRAAGSSMIRSIDQSIIFFLHSTGRRAGTASTSDARAMTQQEEESREGEKKARREGRKELRKEEERPETKKDRKKGHKLNKERTQQRTATCT